MCLLITQPKGVVFDETFLKGVYDYNSDGVGVMFADNGTINIRKYVPRNFAEYLKFYNENVAGRECAWHSRLTTHGDTNLDNAHPYEVLGEADGYPIYMMHNGVLSTGNAKDKTRSDTWHFIQDYLRPMLANNPTFFMHDAFRALLENFIGNGNKFVFMDAYGNTVIINEKAFVEHNGAKLSNTYAWDTISTKYDRPRYPKGGYRGYNSMYGGGWGGFGLLNEDECYGGHNSFRREGNGNKKETQGFVGKSAKESAEVFVKGPMDEHKEQLKEESLEWASEFFQRCSKFGYMKAFQKLTYVKMRAFYEKAGSELSREILDLIPFGCWKDDEELIEEIESMLSGEHKPADRQYAISSLQGTSTEDVNGEVATAEVIYLPSASADE